MSPALPALPHRLPTPTWTHLAASPTLPQGRTFGPDDSAPEGSPRTPGCIPTTPRGSPPTTSGTATQVANDQDTGHRANHHGCWQRLLLLSVLDQQLLRSICAFLTCPTALSHHSNVRMVLTTARCDRYRICCCSRSTGIGSINYRCTGLLSTLLRPAHRKSRTDESKPRVNHNQTLESSFLTTQKFIHSFTAHQSCSTHQEEQYHGRHDVVTHKLTCFLIDLQIKQTRPLRVGAENLQKRHNERRPEHPHHLKQRKSGQRHNKRHHEQAHREPDKVSPLASDCSVQAIASIGCLGHDGSSPPRWNTD